MLIRLFRRIANIRAISHGAAIGAIVLLSTGACGYDDVDRPAISNEQAGTGTGIVEGVAGQIMDRRGRPVVGALVQPRSLDDPSPPIPEVAIVSDGDGRYTWRLVPGRYEISVSAPGYQGVARQITVKAGKEATENFTMERVP